MKRVAAARLLPAPAPAAAAIHSTRAPRPHVSQHRSLTYAHQPNAPSLARASTSSSPFPPHLPLSAASPIASPSPPRPQVFQHVCHLHVYPRRHQLAKAPPPPLTASHTPSDLTIDLLPEDARGQRTFIDILRESGHPSPSTFLAARTDNGELHSLHHVIPAEVRRVTLLTFNSRDEAGRRAFWLSTAYLLRAALVEEHRDGLRLAGAVDATSQLGDGRGFFAQYLPLDGRIDATEQPVTHAADPLERSMDTALALLNSAVPNPRPLDDAQVKALEKRVAKLASRRLEFRVEAVDADEARRVFASNPFKLEELEAVLTTRRDESGKVGLVRLGDFVDLAPGGSTQGFALLPTTKPIKAIKLLECSTASWTPVRATSRPLPSAQSMLYLRGISFPTPAMLKQDAAERADAVARDHRAIGSAQQLFLTHDSSPGTPFLLPDGMRVVRKVERVVRDLYDVWGYDEVQTPQLYKPELWMRSGHWENYRDDMFGVQGYHDVDAAAAAAAAADTGAETAAISAETMPEERLGQGCAAHHHHGEGSSGSSGIGGDAAGVGRGVGQRGHFGLKPMNCPGHCLIFASQERSYRDLPIRYAEFSPLHRNEASGALSGLTRVRRFHQDDAHVFCAASQVRDEIASMLRMLASAYATFGFGGGSGSGGVDDGGGGEGEAGFELALSTRPPRYLGTETQWREAESALRDALEASGRPWTLNAEDGAFYGPKIDVRLVDAAGRRHQTATIQLDFQLPQRFSLRYADARGGRSTPVLIHRAILGSVERFLAVLIEQNRGRWPFWMSPRQVVVLPVLGGDGVGGGGGGRVDGGKSGATATPHGTTAAEGVAAGEGPTGNDKVHQQRDAMLHHARRLRARLALGTELESLALEAATPSGAAWAATRNEDGGGARGAHAASSAADVSSPPRQPPRPSHVFHVEVDASSDTLAKRVRRAQLRRHNLVLVVGEEEVARAERRPRGQRGDHAPPPPGLRHDHAASDGRGGDGAGTTTRSSVQPLTARVRARRDWAEWLASRGFDWRAARLRARRELRAEAAAVAAAAEAGDGDWTTAAANANKEGDDGALDVDDGRGGDAGGGGGVRSGGDDGQGQARGLDAVETDLGVWDAEELRRVLIYLDRNHL